MNDGIDKEPCSLSYLKVDEVARKVVELGKGALLSKWDLKSAYRNVPVHHGYLGSGGGGRKQLLVDSALLRSALLIFNVLADSLTFIIRSKLLDWVEHYLDDFVMVSQRVPGKVCLRHYGYVGGWGSQCVQTTLPG